VLCQTTFKEAQMAFSVSDTIAFKNLNTGGNSAGNGGDGYNSGDLDNHQTAVFKPFNKAYGADADANAGDYVHQKAEWTGAGSYLKKPDMKAPDMKVPEVNGHAGTPGSQTSDSGHNDAKVYADTTAYQANLAKFYQSSYQSAGNGGDGGDHNIAKGGDVSFALVHSDPKAEYKLTEIKESFNHVEYLPLNDLAPA
jgi:hypothetical protein